MVETGIETTEPIFELATECESLFLDHLSRLKNESDFNGAKVVGEYQQRFAAWAAFLGVFAVPDTCLDRRLRNHAEVQDLVLRLLDIMKRNLVHLFEEDIDIPDLDQVPQPQIRVNLESLRGIEGAIDRLNHLGRTIQRSSEAGQVAKVDKFTTTFDSTSFEEIARSAVKSFYPDASASLLSQLVQAMTDMYEKYHYRRSRQVRLQARPKAALFAIGEDPDPDSTVNTERASPQPTIPPVIDVNKQLPRLISTTRLEDKSHKSRESRPTSLDSREFSRLFARQGGGSIGSKTRSILVSQVAYPQPSEESLVCEWCFASLSKDEFKGEKWKKHLNEDFKPFICISEKCKGQANRFATSRAWFSHMLETHGQNWHREIHLPIWWICPLCNSKETTFSRAQDLSEHVSKLHDDILTSPQIQVIVHQSQLRSPRPQDMCPLCCLSMRDEQDKDKEEQPLKVALPDFSLKYQAPVDSNKRVKTETGLNQQIQHGNLDVKGEMTEMVSNTGTQSAEKTQRVTIEAIARHVAAHLQGIMLFTLRMMSLDDPNTTTDEKSLSSSTNRDSSRAGSGHHRLEEETGAIVDMLEEQGDSMEVDDPSAEDTIPDCEHIIDWQDVINDTQQFSGTDSFLQEVIRSGAFHDKESIGTASYIRLGRGEMLRLTSLESSRIPTAGGLVLPRRNEHFVCPEDLFGRITKQASGPASCVTLVGLGGIGKSQLALEFAHRIAAESPEVWVFWIHAHTLEHMEESFRRIAACIKMPVRNLPWVELYQLVCDWLHDEQNGRWILILDGADDPNVLNKISEITNVLRFKRRPLGDIYSPRSLKPNSSATNASSASAAAVTAEIAVSKGSLGPKIWTGTRFLPRFVRAAEVPGEGMCYFYDDGSHCKTVIDGEAVNAHWGVTKAGKPRKRLSISCITCRERKIRCIPDYPRCVPCEKFGIICKFKNAPRGDHNTLPSTSPTEFDDNSRQQNGSLDASSIIVTTRNKDLASTLARGRGSIIEVEPMPVVEATSLFRKILGPKFQPASDMNAAVNLVKGLRLIPLAITQAARYIDKQLSKSTLVNFLKKLEESDDEKMGLLTFDANGIDDSKTIHSTWQTSFDYIRSQRPSAANLLLLMSFFDRRGIPKWLLPSDTQDNNTPRANSPSIMGRLDLDDSDGKANDDSTDTFDGDIDILMNHYFIAANRTRDMFEMHGLVQFAAHRSMSNEEEDAYCDQFIHWLAAAFPRNPLGYWSTCQELFAHVQAAAKYRPSGDALEDWAILLYNGGRYARLLGDYETAKQMSIEVSEREDLQIMGRGWTTERAYTRSLENLSLTALILMDQGLYDEAERQFTQVTDTFKRTRAEWETARSNTDTLTSLNNLASVWRVQGRWKEAEKLLTEVRHHRAEVNKVGPSALATLANLASTYRAQGRYVEATALQEVVLESCKIELGEGHPQTLTNKSNLASLYKIRGELEKAEELQVQAMNARDITFGREHPDTLTSMNGLASIFRAQGRLWEAEELQVQVVELRRTKLGANHPNTMASMNNLALIFYEQGKGEKAIELQSRVVDMCKVKFGDSHPHTLTGINNLALIWKSQGQHEEAMRLMKLCSDDRQSILGQEHPYTVSSMAAVRRWSE